MVEGLDWEDKDCLNLLRDSHGLCELNEKLYAVSLKLRLKQQTLNLAKQDNLESTLVNFKPLNPNISCNARYLLDCNDLKHIFKLPLDLTNKICR